ncbi:MAG: winged helix-turn-helix domain-containing protein [Nitrososphaerota archaeon]|nr:winged helix-turn-helix domain-containing protein [Candidatus Bathyarchaeota archaeon]MDW8048386.1 winged helix-turn-helix domain-containing protein [Nitrososphaerota archaeon]
MSRRSQMEIYIDILKAVAEGRRRPTHVMCRANLSWTRLKRYIDFLASQDLIREEEEEGTIIFSLTQKGRDVISYFRRIEGDLYKRKRIIPSEVYVRP